MADSVLIIDEDASFASTAQRALEARGLQVYIHDDAPIDLVRKLRPSVMMVSVELPRSGASGFSICSRIRRDKQLKSTPILLTSADLTPDAFKRHAETPDHADDYAHKPLQLEDVIARIARLLSAEDDARVDDALRPLTSDLPGAGPDATDDSGDLVGPASAGPPPLPELTVEPWKPLKYEEMVRDRLKMEEPVPPRSRTPDQLVPFLRQRTKFLEARDRAAREAWELIQAQGREMERQNRAFRAELDRRGDELISVKARLDSEETKYSTFEQEITRLFQEVDAKEKDTLEKLRQHEKKAAELTEEVTALQRQHDDDARRLKIYQEEVETLQVEHDAALTNATELEAKNQDLATQIAAERDAASELHGQLEAAAEAEGEQANEIDALNERAAGLQAKVEALDKQRAEERDELQSEHTRALESAMEVHASELEVYEQSLTQQEAKVEELDRQLAEANAALEEQREAVAKLTEREQAIAEELESRKQAVAEGVERQQALDEELEERQRAIDELTESQRSLTEELDRQTATVVKLTEIERALNEELRATSQSAEDSVLSHATAQRALEREHQEALQALREELENERQTREARAAETEAETETRFADMLDAHSEALAAERQEAEAANEQAQQALRDEHEERVDALKAEHRENIDALAEKHREELKLIEVDHAEVIAGLEAEREELDRAHAEAVTLLENAHAASRSEYETMRQRTLASHAEAIEAIEAKHAEVQNSFNDRIATLMAEQDHTQSELDERSGASNTLRENLETAENRITELNDELSALRADSESRTTDLEDEVEDARMELIERLAQLDHANAKLRSADEAKANVDQRLEAAIARIDELEANLVEMADQLEDRDKALNALKTSAKQEAEKTADDTRTRLIEVEAALATKAEESKTLRHDIESREEDIEGLEQMVESLQKELQDRRANTAELASKEEKISKLEADNTALTQELTSLRLHTAENSKQKQLMRRIGLTLRAAQGLLGTEPAHASPDGPTARVQATMFDQTELDDEERVQFGAQSDLQVLEAGSSDIIEMMDGDSDILEVEVSDESSKEQPPPLVPDRDAEGDAANPREVTAAGPFAELMAEIEAEGDAQSRSAASAADDPPPPERPSRPRRKLKPLPNDDAETKAHVAEVADALDVRADIDSPMSADPFVQGVGLPGAGADPFGQVGNRDGKDVEDDGLVTEVVKLESLD